MMDAPYYKEYNKKLDDERKHIRLDTKLKRKKKAIHCTAQELHNVMRIVNEDKNIHF